MTAARETYGLPPARLRWDEDGVPHSLEFEDRYYSSDGGREESEHVFLRGNNLPEAWRDKKHFVIAELGFGSALNFLLVADLWRKSKSPGAGLRYISIESRPMNAGELERSLSRWDLPQDHLSELLSLLPPPIAGTHLITFSDNITLQLCYANAADALEQLSAQVDCWFLDGFSPAKNPTMWSQTVCTEMARLSARGTTFATYSVSSELRTKLELAGFALSKEPGFGRKREMLVGRFESKAAARHDGRSGKALVIGGGLAGAATARSFVDRGWTVSLLEQESTIAAHASGNAAGVLMPHIAAAPDLMSRFYILGYLHTLRILKQLRSGGAALQGEDCGVLRLTSSDRLAKVFAAAPRLGLPESFMRLFSESEAAAFTGFDTAREALYFPGGGWVSPPDLCRALLARGVTQKLSAHVAEFRRESDCWVATDGDGRAIDSGDVLVFCGGYSINEFPQLSWLPIEKVRGQAMCVPANELSKRLKQVVCYDGYISPVVDGMHFLGATYDHENDSTEISVDQNRDLFHRLHEWIPGFPLEYSGSETSRVSFRTMSRDRLPLAGPVPNLPALESAGEPIFRDRWQDSALLPGLYANTGHGSRGLTSCLLSAAVIASHAAGEPLPLESDLLRSVYPARFPVRLLRQGKKLTVENLSSLKVPHLR